MEEWNGGSKILIGGQVVFETEGLLTMEDVLREKLRRGIGSCDVRDVATGKSLKREDFPRTGAVEIIPVFKPGN